MQDTMTTGMAGTLEAIELDGILDESIACNVWTSGCDNEPHYIFQCVRCSGPVWFCCDVHCNFIKDRAANPRYINECRVCKAHLTREEILNSIRPV